MELRRNTRSFVMLAVVGVLLPLILTMLDESPLFALAIAIVFPMTTAGMTCLKDRITGDAQFFQGLPVTGYVYGASLLSALAIEAALAVGFVSPHLWGPYVALELGGGGLFALALLALGAASWTTAALVAATSMRFRAERAMAWGIVGFVAFGAAFDRFAWPRLEPYLGPAQVAEIVRWTTTPAGASVSLLLLVVLAAAAIALAMRWLRSGIEGYRREDHVVKL